jgi:hypothetical protein
MQFTSAPLYPYLVALNGTPRLISFCSIVIRSTWMRKEMTYVSALGVAWLIATHANLQDYSWLGSWDAHNGAIWEKNVGRRRNGNRGKEQGNKFAVKTENKGSGSVRTGVSPEHFAFMIIGRYYYLRVNERTFTAVATNALIWYTIASGRKSWGQGTEQQMRITSSSALLELCSAPVTETWAPVGRRG